MKKLVAILLALVLVMSLVACGAKPAAKEDDGKIAKVGLCMPTKEQTIWTMQADRLEKALTAAGFEVLVEFAEDDSARQATQIENMISKGVDCLIIAAVDSFSLTESCEKAKEAGILVIADDRAIQNTKAVDYYVTCDYFRLAQMQGEYIRDALDLDNTTESYTMEIFAGSPDDANSVLFHNGQMDILQPYIDAGKLVIKSGDTEIAATKDGNTYKFTMPGGDVVVESSFAKIRYALNIAKTTGGTVTADKETYAMNETVTVTIKPDTGYSRGTMVIKNGDKEIEATRSGLVFTFKMPGAPVDVEHTFKKNAYELTIDTSSKGEIVADKETYGYKDIVTLTVRPGAGYELNAIAAKNGTVKLELKKIAENKYTFEMPIPDGEIIIAATYKEASK